MLSCPKRHDHDIHGDCSICLLDGHLFLPHYKIFLDSPNNCIDIHGLGGMNENDGKSCNVVYDPTPHCVASQKTVLQCVTAMVYPQKLFHHPALVHQHCLRLLDVNCFGKQEKRACHVSSGGRVSIFGYQTRLLTITFLLCSSWLTSTK